MPVIANLLELYAHDFSEFHSVELGPDGRFGYPDLPLYWSEPERHPFLIRVDGKLAGFALIREILPVSGTNSIWDMAEFFVLRAYRTSGVGTNAAKAVWRQFPGNWQVRVMRSNRVGLGFWLHAIDEFAGGKASSSKDEKAGEIWDIFSFTSTAQH
ncbi:MAG: GNAT family N-acetyltransferase [Terracidiphilus sp.]